MATLLLSFAGATLGGLGGSAFGAVAGRAIGGLIGSRIDREILGATTAEQEINATLPSADAGAVVPRAYGRIKISGQLIWATAFTSQQVGGKASQSAAGKPDEVFANFAIALCEGEIATIGRIWADGKLIRRHNHTIRIYTGSQTQPVDSLISAKQGADKAPAYRGLAYLVFEQFKINRYGNRLPVIEVEVIRPVGALERHLKAVAIIPGASEFVYHPRVVSQTLGPGKTQRINRNSTIGRTDLKASVHELIAICPQLKTVSLVVAWFGNDLRCANCTLKPAVETRTADTQPVWQAAGLSRSSARLVSTFAGNPAYGGTPSDAAIVEAIAYLNAQGLKVSLYPFIMMDIAAGNTRADPYSSAGTQPVHPWRGRITCDPAPGQSATVDQTAAAASQIASFVGTVVPGDFTISANAIQCTKPDEWSYRRMILHLATLTTMAGGVDSFFIGSEMRGLTSVRADPSSFPFVDALAALATDVRFILGSGPQLSYAADWSEYFGHHPDDGSGDVYFNLDPIWAHPEIDAVSIDYYMPLSDWRGDVDHLDRAAADSEYDPIYLNGNLSAGEGYEWYYPSAADREAQHRSQITDFHGEPHVFRYKDIWSWWSTLHRNRPGGTPLQATTGWVPQSKPIWLSEVGCPAVHLGANQPNVFPDPKSSESALPYFSAGQRDDLIQRRYLEAVLAAFDPEFSDEITANNPTSTLTGKPMVDVDRIYGWAWDAKPYPAFPAASHKWSDSGNWATGHWLTGRLGQADLAGLVSTILLDDEVANHQTTGLQGTLAGYVRGQLQSSSDTLAPLSKLFEFSIDERGAQLQGRHFHRPENLVLPDDLRVLRPDKSQMSRIQADDQAVPTGVTIRYFDVKIGYQTAATFVGQPSSNGGHQQILSLPAAFDSAAVPAIGSVWLRRQYLHALTVEFSVPPGLQNFGVGDIFCLGEESDGQIYRSFEIIHGNARRLRAHRIDAISTSASSASLELLAEPTPWQDEGSEPPTTPHVLLLDVAQLGDEPTHPPKLAVFADPWPGEIDTYSEEFETLSWRHRARQPATVGILQRDLVAGFTTRIERGTETDVEIFGGELASVSAAQLLAGSNRCAIRATNGEWELLQFQNAELIGERYYRLSTFIRGLRGTEDATAAGAASGAEFVMLNDAINPLEMKLDEVQAPQSLLSVPSGADSEDASLLRQVIIPAGRGLRPPSPCHVRAFTQSSGDICLSWIRRGRFNADSWLLPEIVLGEEHEIYAVEIRSSEQGLPVRSWQVSAPTLLYPATEILADFGAVPSEMIVDVWQIGALAGIKRRGVIRV